MLPIVVLDNKRAFTATRRIIDNNLISQDLIKLYNQTRHRLYEL